MAELGEDRPRRVGGAIVARRAARRLIGEIADEAEARGETKHILPRRQVVLERDLDAGLRRRAGNVEGRTARNADADALDRVVDVAVGDRIIDAAVGARGVDRDIEVAVGVEIRSEEHTSELQSLMRNSYAVFCLKKKTNTQQ